MKNAILIISVLASSLFAGAVLAGEAEDAAPEVVKAAANSLAVKAVKEQNNKGASLGMIQEIDKSWMDTTDAHDEPNRQPWQFRSPGRQSPIELQDCPEKSAS
jgi:hypothetical protein